jgi:hypothetical protein
MAVHRAKYEIDSAADPGAARASDEQTELVFGTVEVGLCPHAFR